MTPLPLLLPTDLALLQGMAIFGGISAENLQRLVALHPAVSRARGELFFCEGEPGDAMFVLLAGRVAVIRHWEGRDYVLREIHAGDCFGELSLVDLGPRSGTALAREDCRALQFSQADFYTLYKTDPQQFTLIQMNMGREVARKLRDAVERLFQARTECQRDDPLHLLVRD